jgi:hypothetical protein
LCKGLKIVDDISNITPLIKYQTSIPPITISDNTTHNYGSTTAYDILFTTNPYFPKKEWLALWICIPFVVLTSAITISLITTMTATLAIENLNENIDDRTVNAWYFDKTELIEIIGSLFRGVCAFVAPCS